MAWQSFRVMLKGEAEPVEVETNAFDWAGVTIDPSAPKALDMTWRAIHAGLVRTGAPVPRDYRGFLEVLDGMPETLDDGDESSPTDPTTATRSDG